MLITAEMVKEYADKPAVFACKVSAGTTIGPEHLEHPMFLDDMVSSNLLTLKGALTIGQVIGVKTVKECNALTPITEEVVGEAVRCAGREAQEEESAVVVTETKTTVRDGNAIIISIKEGKDIYLEFPL